MLAGKKLSRRESALYIYQQLGMSISLDDRIFRFSCGENIKHGRKVIFEWRIINSMNLKNIVYILPSKVPFMENY